jgi:hypothetical protein
VQTITRASAQEQGLTHYFAGKPCRRGHVSLRRVDNYSCEECNSLNRAKPSQKERRAAYAKERNQKPETKAKVAKRRHERAEELREYHRNYRQANNLSEYYSRRYQENKGEINAATRARYAEDIEFQLMTVLRGRFKKIIRGERSTENCRRLVGCTLDELRVHIESQFLPGMTWENRGLRGWHIDHIRPCASFDLTDPAQRAQCFHYTNLQPLWAADNLAKSTKWEAA